MAQSAAPIDRFWDLNNMIDRNSARISESGMMAEILALMAVVFTTSSDARRAFVSLNKHVHLGTRESLILLLELRKYFPEEYQKFETKILTAGSHKVSGIDPSATLLITYLQHPELKALTEGTPLNFDDIFSLFFPRMLDDAVKTGHARGGELREFIKSGKDYYRNSIFLETLPKLLAINSILTWTVIEIPRVDPSLASTIVRMILPLIGRDDIGGFLADLFKESYFWTLSDADHDAVCDLMLKLPVYNRFPSFLIGLWSNGRKAVVVRVIERISGGQPVYVMNTWTETLERSDSFEGTLLASIGRMLSAIVVEFVQETNLMKFLELTPGLVGRVLADPELDLKRKVSFFNIILASKIVPDSMASRRWIETLSSWITPLKIEPPELASYIRNMFVASNAYSGIGKVCDAKYQLILLGERDRVYRNSAVELENIFSKSDVSTVIVGDSYEDLKIDDQIFGFKLTKVNERSYQFFVADRETGYYKFFYPVSVAMDRVHLYRVTKELIYLILDSELIIINRENFNLQIDIRSVPAKTVEFTAGSNGTILGTADGFTIFDNDHKLLGNVDTNRERENTREDFFRADDYLCCICADKIVVVGIDPSGVKTFDFDIGEIAGIEHVSSGTSLYLHYMNWDDKKAYIEAFDLARKERLWRFSIKTHSPHLTPRGIDSPISTKGFFI